MRVLMIPNDFPTDQDPYRSPFNYMAAKELRKFVDLRILVLRAWLPGRKIVQASFFDEIPVITATGPIIPNYDKINLVLYNRFIWPFIRSCFQRVDLIHSVGVDFAGLLGGIWAKKTNLPHVTQFIADVNCLKSDFKSFPYLENLTNNLHGISCDGKSLSKSARILFPKITNIKYIYRGVDLIRFTPDGPGGGPLKDCPPTRFLFLGGLPNYSDRKFGDNTKGGITLMAAWQKAEDDLSSLGAHLLFAGPAANNRKAKNWRDGLKYPGNVFLLDRIKSKDVPGIIRSAEVVLMPSMDDGLPQLSLEASACGIPVLGSNLDCISEIVVNGKTGILVPAGNVTEWANILVHYANPDKIAQLKQMGTCAREHMEAHFDYKLYAPQIIELYNNALAMFC